MKRAHVFSCLYVVCLAVLPGRCAAQEIRESAEFEPLVLVRIIPIPGAGKRAFPGLEGEFGQIDAIDQESPPDESF